MSLRALSLNQCYVNDLLDQIKCFTLIAFLYLCVFFRLSVFWFLTFMGRINGQYFACKVYLNPLVALANVLSKAMILLLIIQYLLLLQLSVWELCWFLVLWHSYFMPFLVLHFNCFLAVICLPVFYVSSSQCHVLFVAFNPVRAPISVTCQAYLEKKSGNRNLVFGNTLVILTCFSCALC